MPIVLMHSPGAKEMGYVLQGPFCCTHPRWPVMKLVTRTCSLLSLTRTPPDRSVTAYSVMPALDS